jgi:hypothetical protein
MFKNVAGQFYRVFAFNLADNQPVTGASASITAKLSKDFAAPVAANDVNPTEVEDGYYLFALTQAETNCDDLAIYPEHSTSTIQVIGCPASHRPRPDDTRGFLVNLTIRLANNEVVPYCEVIITTSDTSDTTDLYRKGNCDELGKIDLYLPAGTFYLWRRKANVTFTDPKTLTVASDGTTTIS